jgi:tripartite-type tricarboxylate transporter receptor subunit TctC
MSLSCTNAIPLAASRRNPIKRSRRKLLQLSAAALFLSAASALAAAPQQASAQAYPSRPVRLIVTFPAGGPNDILARVIGQALSERLGQSIIVENRSGAAGNVGTEVAVHAAADGYTLLFVNTPNAINATLYAELDYNFIRDIAPVARTVLTPLVVEVNPSLPVKTIPELIAYAKANPGALNMASGGSGTPGHVSGELFQMMTGIKMVHVPYHGGAPALNDLLGGRVQVIFDPIPASMGYIRSGKLRVLAVTSAARSEALPDVPTVGEFVPGYEASAWYGIGAPKDTPASIIDKLNVATNAVMADPKLKARLANLGGVPAPDSPSDFGRFIAAETAKWAKVVKFAGITPQ